MQLLISSQARLCQAANDSTFVWSASGVSIGAAALGSGGSTLSRFINPSILHLNHAITAFGQFAVMCGHNQGDAFIGGQFKQ